jgi:hypothetical protein
LLLPLLLRRLELLQRQLLRLRLRRQLRLRLRLLLLRMGCSIGSFHVFFRQGCRGRVRPALAPVVLQHVGPALIVIAHTIAGRVFV